MNILIVEDDKNQRFLMDNYFGKKYNIGLAKNYADFTFQMEKNIPDIVITDMNLEDEKNGLDIIKRAKELSPAVRIIVLTAYGNIENAVEAIKLGADHYVQKPVNLNELDLYISKCYKTRELITENQLLKTLNTDQYDQDKFISKIALTDSTILITGSSGTGKSFLAQKIHKISRRKEKKMITINCATIPGELMESELFGHKKGSFTGAISDKTGKFEQAHGGTVFLDEIGELPLILQPKLLRTIQDKVIEPVGGNEKQVDFRLIVATNKDLKSMVEEGKFREDLYFRLKVFSVEMAGLKHRKELIPELCLAFIDEHNLKTGKKIKTLSSEVEKLFQQYKWPGNIRELKNAIEYSVVMEDSDSITISSLPGELVENFKHTPNDNNQSPVSKTPFSLEESVEEFEKKAIENALDISDFNQSKAAEFLGINERKIRYKMKKYYINKPGE
ncbi:sigma-54-dependent Fis family transcriptional regulator [bacterium]|nr:sigma-54-dependent Fis family transcriptional regulator [bacterium]